MRRDVLILPATTLTSALLVFGGLAWKGDHEAKKRFDLEARWEALTTRPFEGRLAGLEAFKPFKPAQPTPLPRLGAELSPPHRGPRATQAASRPLLELLDGRGCPSAVSKLEALTRSEAGAHDWRKWSNLALAHLACVPSAPEKAGQALEHRLEAIEASTKALALEPNAPEAAFNRALGLAALPIPHQARLAWDRYLELDRESEWAEEARRRRETPLPAPNLPPSLTAKRYRAERELLPAWTEALVARDEQAAHQAAAELEALLEELGLQGDAIAAAVGTVREAEATGDKKRLELLAAGHRAFAAGEQKHAGGQSQAARGNFDLAVEALETGTSQFSQHAGARRFLPRSPASEITMETFRRRAEEAGLKTVAAEVLHASAYWASLEGRSWAAIDQYQEAAERFETLGMWEEQAVMKSMRAELLAELGMAGEALNELATSVPLRPFFTDPWSRYASGWVTTTSFSLLGRFPRASQAFRRELIADCPAMPHRPFCAVDTHLEIARHLEGPREVSTELSLAEEALLLTPDDEGRRRTTADLALLRARQATQHADVEPLAALPLYDRAIEIYSELELPVQVAIARTARANEHARLGQPDEAQSDLTLALAEIRRWDRDSRFRSTMGESASPRGLRQIYERLIGLQVAEGSAEASRRALLYSDELRDRLAPRLGRELATLSEDDLGRFLEILPENTAVVEYALLRPAASETDAKAFAWVLTRKSIERVDLTLPTDLATSVAGFQRAAVARDLALWQELGAELGAAVLSPVLAVMPSSVERLLVLPDSQLHNLPLAGFWDARRGRYLGEEFTVAFAPSVRFLLLRADRASPIRQRHSVLSVGISEFGTLGLSSLPRATTEAQAVAGAYDEVGVVTCGSHRWSDLRHCLTQASVVHLVTHATANSTASGTSWLATEEETVDLDQLWAEIPLLPHRPLVVLSACESVATSDEGEGLGSLARPFLAHGAAAVVGTLWPLLDEVGAEIFPVFHRAYSDSGGAAQAARVMRESLADWAERPWDWAGVTVVTSDL